MELKHLAQSRGDGTQAPAVAGVLGTALRALTSRRAVQLILILLPVTAAMGGLVRVVGPLFAFRVLLLVFVGLSVHAYRSLPWRSTVVRLLVAMAAVWLLVGYASLLWAADRERAITQLFGLTLGLALSIAMVIQFARDEGVVRAFVPGWTIAFIVTGVIGTYERVSGHHLSNYLRDAAVPALVAQRYVASVFGNPNAYAAFLVTAFPFLLWGFLDARERARKAAFGIALVTLLPLLLLTGSRLCLLALSVQILVTVAVLARRRARAVVLFAAGGLIVASATGSFARLASVVPFIPSKLLTRMDLASLSSELASTSGSGGERLNLLRDGLWMVGKSRGLGVGAGSFEANIARAPFPTHGIVDPHNLWMEILAEYGALVFAVVTSFIGLSFVLGLKLLGRAKTPENRAARSLGIVIVTAILGNAIAAVANSTYLESSTNWLFLGCLAVLAFAAEQALHSSAEARMRRTHTGIADVPRNLAAPHEAPNANDNGPCTPRRDG